MRPNEPREETAADETLMIRGKTGRCIWEKPKRSLDRLALIYQSCVKTGAALCVKVAVQNACGIYETVLPCQSWSTHNRLLINRIYMRLFTPPPDLAWGTSAPYAHVHIAKCRRLRGNGRAPNFSPYALLINEGQCDCDWCKMAHRSTQLSTHLIL